MYKKRKSFIIICLLSFIPFYLIGAGRDKIVLFKPEKGAFTIAEGKFVAPILIDTADYKVVSKSTKLLTQDLQLVSGIKPSIYYSNNGIKTPVIIAGTIGKSKFIDNLISSGKLSVDTIKGKWESYLITVVKKPFTNVPIALVITGSDRRGTAYGITEISKQMGVSPWYWWADVPVKKRTQIYVKDKLHVQNPPSVQYRGIFINDEDWGMRPWAAKNFDTARNMGPMTYEKIFELMVRHRANYLWPAMHGGTKAFNFYPQNKVLADEYAIVMGSSHAEPMLRNNVSEWDKKTGEWNYDINRDKIYNYWENRLKENGKYENIYSLGLRGIHDDPMEGGETMMDKIKILQTVIEDQRKLISQNVNKNVEAVPQVFIPYKEVLYLYKNGLKLPDDVTLMWTDDNYGYLKKLNNPIEVDRKGGSGIYYHLSYLGRPHDYTWLGTTSPWLVWFEMKKAWDFNAKKMWVFNIGDIKPLEFDLSFVMDLAYNMENYKKPKDVTQYFNQWYAEIFGDELGEHISNIKKEYYNLAFTRRPEFMGWDRLEPITPARETEFSFENYDEGWERINRYLTLENNTLETKKKLDPLFYDCYYQLVEYPVLSSANMNFKHLYAQLNRDAVAKGYIVSALYKKESLEAFDKLKLLMEQYWKINNNKWKHMVSWWGIGTAPVYKEPNLDSIINVLPKGWETKLIGNTLNEHTFIFKENQNSQNSIVIYNKGKKFFDWKVLVNNEWIKCNKTKGKLDTLESIEVTLNNKLLPPSDSIKGSVLLDIMGDEKKIDVIYTRLPKEIRDKIDSIYLEENKVVSIPCTKPVKINNNKNGNWKIIPNIGSQGAMMGAFLITKEPIEHEWALKENSPSLEYNFYTYQKGWFDLYSYALPVHPINEMRHTLYAVSIDDQPAVIIDIQTGHRSEEWKENVLRNMSIKKTSHYIEKNGIHKLKIWMIDSGMALDKVVLDFGGLKNSYLGPK